MTRPVLFLRRKIADLRRNELISRFSRVFSVDAILKASNFLLLPIYLRLMTQSEFGTYGYLTSIVGMYASGLNFGMFVAQGKLFHDYPEERKGSLIFTVNVLLAVFLAASLALVAATGWDVAASEYLFAVNPVDYSKYRWVMMAAVVSSIYTTMVTTHFFNSINIRGIQRYNYSKLLFLSPLVLFVLFWIPGDKVEIRFKAFTILELLLLAVFAVPYLKAARAQFDVSMARKAVKIGIPSAATGLIGVAYGLSDRFIMEKFYPMTEMAILNLSLTACTVITMLFSSFQGVWVPVFFKEKDRRAAYARVGRVARLLAAALGALGLCMWLALGICLWSGLVKPGYSAVLTLLPLTIAAAIFQCVQHMYANFCVYFEETYVGTIAVAATACATVGFNLFLIPRLSYYGAGVTGLTVSGGAFLCYYLYARRKCLTVVDSRDGSMPGPA